MSLDWAAFLRPGDVVIAMVSNLRENPGAAGKARPVIWLGRVDGRHAVAGITSKATHASNGEPRRRLVTDLGNGATSYLWGGQLLVLPRDQLGKPTGYRLEEADMAQVEAQHGDEIQERFPKGLLSGERRA